VHPADAVDELGARCPPGFRCVAQRGIDLAQRMGNALVDAAAAGFARILLRGSDNPSLAGAELVRGLAALDGADPRGGSRPRRGLRLDRAARRAAGPVRPCDEHRLGALGHAPPEPRCWGCDVKELEPHFDLDTAADLALLASARGRGEARDCPRTLALLDELRLWPAQNLGTPVPSN
jgi:hypothetical protein